MKRISLIVCSFLMSTFTYAQYSSSPQEQYNIYSTRTIEVVGSASVELEPDQVYVSFTLKDFIANGKTITIDKSEQEVKKLLTTLCVDLKNLVVVNLYGYMSYADGANSVSYQSRKTYRV